MPVARQGCVLATSGPPRRLTCFARGRVEQALLPCPALAVAVRAWAAALVGRGVLVRRSPGRKAGSQLHLIEGFLPLFLTGSFLRERHQAPPCSRRFVGCGRLSWALWQGRSGTGRRRRETWQRGSDSREFLSAGCRDQHRLDNWMVFVSPGSKLYPARREHQHPKVLASSAAAGGRGRVPPQKPAFPSCHRDWGPVWYPAPATRDASCEHPNSHRFVWLAGQRDRLRNLRARRPPLCH